MFRPLFFRSALRWASENPSKVASAWIGGTLAACAVIDYNRELTRYPEFTPTSRHLGNYVAAVHRFAFNESLNFDTITTASRCSEESYHLFKSAIAKKPEVRQSLEEIHGHDAVSEDRVEAAVVQQHLGFAREMARRALIRNGNYIKWAEAVIHDEYIVVAVPVVALVAMTFL